MRRPGRKDTDSLTQRKSKVATQLHLLRTRITIGQHSIP